MIKSKMYTSPSGRVKLLTRWEVTTEDGKEVRRFKSVVAAKGYPAAPDLSMFYGQTFRDCSSSIRKVIGSYLPPIIPNNEKVAVTVMVKATQVEEVKAMIAANFE